MNEYPYFDEPTQLLYWDLDMYAFGIGYHDEIICTCCGDVLTVQEVIENAIGDNELPILAFPDCWVDLTL